MDLLPRFLLVPLFLLLSCSSVPQDFDEQALRNAGISGSAIEKLRALNLDRQEIQEVVAAKGAGMAEQNLVELCRIYHDRDDQFRNGGAVVALRNAGTSDETVLALAQRELLDGWVKDVVALRRAGFSDRGVLELADTRQKSRHPIPAGSSLARLKHTGLSEEAVIGLVKKGLRDSDVETIEAMRRSGKDENEILRDFRAR